MGEMADFEMESGFDAYLDGYGGEDGEYDDDNGDYITSYRRPRKPRGKGPCPRCGGEMRQCLNKAQGTTFYGCKRYPECTGTRDG